MVAWRRLAVALAAWTTMAACTSSVVTGPVPSVSTRPIPSATPSLTCTGTGPAPSPYPCDAGAKDAEQRQLEEQAKAVYARYWKEYTRLLEAGGASEATPELKATVAEPMLANVVALLKHQKDNGWKPQPFIASYKIQVRAEPVRADADVSVIVCEDTSGSVLYDVTGQRAGTGVLAVQVRALRRVDGGMKIYGGDAQPAGTPCPIN